MTFTLNQYKIDFNGKSAEFEPFHLCLPVMPRIGDQIEGHKHGDVGVTYVIKRIAYQGDGHLAAGEFNEIVAYVEID